MDLDSAADELYASSPDDFVARRKDLVGQARQAGDRELVKQIGQLRRPTRTGWLVNLLAREAPDDVAALLALGRELGEAQQRGSGADLRRLSQQRRTAVDALATRAVRLGREHDYQPPDAALQEVAQTLQAALGDAETAELVRRGRLTQAATYGGFGPSDLTATLAASQPSQPAPEESPSAAAEPVADPSAEDQQRRQAAREAAATAQTAWDQARDALAAGEEDAERTTREADELAEELERLRSRLHDTETAERAAREEARTARKRLTELRRAAAVAEQTATATAAEVDG